MAEPIHPATKQLLDFFNSEHLPADLASVVEPFRNLAWDLVASGLGGAEVTAGLRKLLESKDCFVRAAVLARGEEG